jgi:iron uptake system EfeUOB component EfeO/EfeM
MSRLNQVFIITVISLMASVGCNNAEKSTPQSSSTASPASQVSTSVDKTNFNGLKGVVSKAKTAVVAGNFSSAKNEFSKFEGFWSKVEDNVRSKSPHVYKAIEDDSDTITKGLKASAPNKQKVLQSLQSLDKNVNDVVKQ